MIKSLWKDPVWSKVIATGILALLTYLGAYLLGLSPAIIAFFAQSWGFFTATSSVPNWLIGLMTIPCLVLGWALVVELKSRMSAEVTEPVNWNSYQRDNFLVYFGVGDIQEIVLKVCILYAQIASIKSYHEMLALI
jgi:hypothetical protein